MNTVYLQTYFLTIACILGTGILGLPVTLYNSGFYPFLVIFTIAFIMQVLIIFINVEILQKAHAIQVKYDKIELLPLKEMLDEDTCDELEDQPENGGPVLAGHVILSKHRGIRSPDLHFLGEMFLCNGIRHFFDLVIIMVMMTMLTAYSLGGSEAYGDMLQIKHIYVIPVFTWCLTLLIVFAINIIQPVVSILTFIKASLFTLAVVVTFFVTSEVHENYRNDFNHIQDSFLMGTVALGGTFLVMPFLFRKIENDTSQIKKFRIALVMGLVTCLVLNILWCWAVIEIVPQHCPSIVGINHSSSSTMECHSLKNANENGKISTQPLIKIIHQKSSAFVWVAIVVELFIIISITVSFLTIGTALHHIICGIVESNFPVRFLSPDSKRHGDIAKKCVSSIISLMLFAIVFVIAMLNPEGFLDVMEKFTSSALNIVNILFFTMFMKTRNKENKNMQIPVSLSKWLVPVVYVLPLYFGIAIGYDIYISILSFLPKETDNLLESTTSHLYNMSFSNTTSIPFPTRTT